MSIPNKKLQSGLELPVIGLGTALFGGGREPDFRDDESSLKTLKEAIKMGYSHIDTAEMYGGGHSEELVGQAIQDFNRERLTIATKVSDINLEYHQILKSAESSLKRLGVDYLDLYYVHAPSPSVSLADTMKAMDKLVDEGLVRNIGVSNFPVELLQQAQELSQHKIVANQIEYNLMTREVGSYGSAYGKNVHMESKILPYCQANDIFVVACRPLGFGTLLKNNSLLNEASNKYNRSYAEIAINWLISQDNVVSIVMSKNLSHLQENVKAVDWTMEEKDIEKMRKEFPRMIQPSPTSLVGRFKRLYSLFANKNLD